MKAAALVIALVALLGGADAAGSTGQAGVAYGGPQPWNLRGDVLVFDVSSLTFQGNHPAFPAYSKPEQCADACDATLGCSGWTFCSRKEGCGTGCAAYVAAHPQLPRAEGNPTVTNPAWYKLASLPTFGPWGLTANCQYACDANGSCKPGDQFPQGMCTLKKLAKPTQPEWWSKNPAEGWVSGWVSVPPVCGRLPARACGRCLASRDPAGCLACATNPKLDASMLRAALNHGTLSLQDGCGACFNESTAPAQQRCADCMRDGAACNVCALSTREPGRAFDVGTCVQCVQSLGPRYQGACTACAALAARADGQGAVKQCVACLNRMRTRACPYNPIYNYTAGCFEPEFNGASACATCASSAADYGTCLACLERSPFSQDCEACAWMPADKQARCSDCLRHLQEPSQVPRGWGTTLLDAAGVCVGVAGLGRSSCRPGSAPPTRLPAQVDMCLECLTSKTIPAQGKEWCWACHNWCGSNEGRRSCTSCLAKPLPPGAMYWQQCACP